MEYRREIDGLRALAVVPVVLFHAHFTFLPGGFAGVDVFFVISGFLITSIFCRDPRWPSVDLISFYERRMRRVAPALLFIIAAILPIAWLWMLPQELNNFGKSIYSVILFFSNFLFWQETGYFSPANELKPLLHTWSLALEEQFYIIFPILLLLTRRWKRPNQIGSLIFLSVLSLLLTQIVPLYDPVANFYLLPTRFWEIGAGCTLALLQLDRKPSWQCFGGLAAILGLCLIIGSYVFVTESDWYPGWRTVPVVLGTLLILAFAGPQNLVGRFLGIRPLVFMGLISYSFYLWHQPLFALWGLRDFDGITKSEYAALIALAFLLSIATYRFIERPFRDRRFLTTRFAIPMLFVVALFLGAIGGVGDYTNGFAAMRPDVVAANARAQGLGSGCEDRLIGECTTAPNPEIAVWGDSFARHLINGIMGSHDGVRLVQLTKSKCAPFLGMSWDPSGESQSWASGCLKHNAEIMSYIANKPSIRFVVISSPFINSIIAPHVLKSDGTRVSGGYDLILQELTRTLDQIASNGAQPVIFAPPPRDGNDHGICVARTVAIGIAATPCNIWLHDTLEYDRLVTRLMHDISELYPVVSLRSFLCGGSFCSVVDAGVPLYENDGHLSENGSLHLGKTLKFYDAISVAGTTGCSEEAGDRPHGICELR
ncbi:acyltransferase family protein [Agrobacterium sp. rho-13.3]|jgi:peptidoglycan/LPS O-acetylase OafA/YrhL|uniref:acyltransferase family protein n=1 Tax=Agrobacterium sp. rho-13.3 TaxID=3072980 RepID=UPI002A10942F|nr:acyltransferase family protein [Agrobacterium sp. rho-13.3]MDX8309900.1 acyltransferase family protein [Agrobacterium sp. rho-13.3]